MKKITKYVFSRVGIGLLVIVPIYLSSLVLFEAVHSLQGFLVPIAEMMPNWLHAELLMALLVLFMMIFLLGVFVRTSPGQYIQDKIERVLLDRIPGYSIVRSLAQRFAGEETDTSWKPALVETDQKALMPAFIIEELPDGRYTVFVPSLPTPLAGAVFVYQRERVHPVDIPFSQALQMISQWGEGTKELVAAMERSDSGETV